MSQTLNQTLNAELSHGTSESTNLPATKRFYEEFLGLTVINPLPMAMYASAGGTWQLVCVRANANKPQDRNNRFCLHVADDAAVRTAYEAALRDRDNYGIKEIGPLQTESGALCFILQDQDNTWWEISNNQLRPLGHLGQAAA